MLISVGKRDDKMKTATELRDLLARIDRRGYPAYKDMKGRYSFPGYVLSVDHVQGDPFASPSKLSVYVDGRTAGFPERLYNEKHRRIAFQDELTRRFGRQTGKAAFKAKGSGKSGLISVSRCGQEVLERTACSVDPKDGGILMRFEVGLPANGRTINGREAEKIIFQLIPECVKGSLLFKKSDEDRLAAVADLTDDQQYIRGMLPKLGLCAFIADGSVLPRESGISQRPMKGGVRFRAPEEMKVEMELPHRGRITGMGIRKGITLIVGGGYHGKSTLLKALELGVYDHISGDGREYVITDGDAVKIRAEDGRSIKGTDISMFINDLPNGKDTKRFSTADASGSTSQAANVIESMEAGASLFLIDEDTSATNFMIRDELMQRVIHRDMEPITPFIDRIRELYESYGISTVIVAGSSGAYFHVADSIIQMDRYVPKDITDYAKKEAESTPATGGMEDRAEEPSFDRLPAPSSAFRDGGRIKLKTMGREAISIDRESIDLRYVEQIADSEQVTALGHCLKYAERNIMDGRRSLREVVDEVEKVMDTQGLEAVCESRSSVANMARPRRQEIFACLDRYRSLEL